LAIIGYVIFINDSSGLVEGKGRG